MKINRSHVLIGCVALAALLAVGTLLGVFFWDRSTPSGDSAQKTQEQKRKPKRSKTKKKKSGERRVELVPARLPNKNSDQSSSDSEDDEEKALTVAQRALLDELQEALDDESFRRVAKIVKQIQDDYRKGGDAVVPSYMREQAVEALSWFLPDSLAELIGFMADSNPDVLEDVMKNFTEGIDDAELSDRELADIFKKVAPLIQDDDAIDAILMGLENDMRNSVAVETYKEIAKTGSDAIKQRLVESMQDFTGEDDITTPEQLDKWLKDNPDDEDDEGFYGKGDKDDPDDDDAADKDEKNKDDAKDEKDGKNSQG